MSATEAPRPVVLGLKPSFGFGDRLGVATPGHIAACRGSRLQPVFAQQSMREMERTERTPQEVMACAVEGIRAEGWDGPWGADADHLKTRDDVRVMADAGFTFFTIDPSAHVDNGADALAGKELEEAFAAVLATGAFESRAQVEDLYLGRRFELDGEAPRALSDRETLCRAVVKYGRAIAYAAEVAGWIAEATAGREAEIEISVDETERPTTEEEHLFIALELRRRGVQVVSLAPRFVGDFEKGIDYKGDLETFDAALRVHAAIARTYGPYKISVHSGSDKFAIYPSIGRICGDLLHVKTAGTSYLEALRVAARRAPGLFLEIARFAVGRYDDDKATYHVSADLGALGRFETLSPADLEALFLDRDDGRQVLHVTFGSVLTRGVGPDGVRFKTSLMEVLTTHDDLYREVLESHLGRHVRLLDQG